MSASFQSRGLQCVLGIFPTHVVPGQAAQLGVNQRHQLIERRPVASAPRKEQLRDFV
jgi:hypothetical protein